MHNMLSSFPKLIRSSVYFRNSRLIHSSAYSSVQRNEFPEAPAFLASLHNETVEDNNKNWQQALGAKAAATLTGRMKSKMNDSSAGVDEIAQALKLCSSDSKFRNRKLLNNLFASISANLSGFSFPDLLSIINSCAKLGISSDQTLNSIVDELTARIESSNPSLPPYDEDSTDLPIDALLQPEFELNSVTPIQLVEAIHCLSRYQIYHSRFWTLSTSALSLPCLSHLSPPHLATLLESFARIDLRLQSVLHNVSTVLFAPTLFTQLNDDMELLQTDDNQSVTAAAVAAGVNCPDGLSLSILVRLSSAFASLSYWTEETEAQIDSRIQKYITQITKGVSRSVLEDVIKFLYSICCLRNHNCDFEMVISCLTILTEQKIPATATHQLLSVIDLLNAEHPHNHLMPHELKLIIDQLLSNNNVKQKKNGKDDNDGKDNNDDGLKFRSDCQSRNAASFRFSDLDKLLGELRIETKPLEVNFGERSFSITHSIVDKKIVILTLGPSNFYINTTQETAATNLMKRYIQAKGLSVVSLPYFQWAALKNKVEKKRFLLSILR